MLSFECDYVAGAHPKVMEALERSNLEHLPGYGTDHYWKSAGDKIRAACQCPEADVYFLTGGTQTNAIVISTLLKSFEGVVSADTAHIAGHEAGAIEYTGHKVLTLPHHEGKLSGAELRVYLQNCFSDDNLSHMVHPGMVYITHPTEFGTLYTAAELKAVSEVCHEFGLPLYLDGARLGYGLMSPKTDVTLPMIAKYCDAFYIGGTKMGALCGEAVVFTKGNMPKQFPTIVKHHGAMLAKGRILSVQFDALFTDNLYFDLGRHAVDLAMELKRGLLELGCWFYVDTSTNLQFVIMHKSATAKLRETVNFNVWENFGHNHDVVRFSTSWSTTREEVLALIEEVRKLTQ